ncbi:hypothetical protein [Sulfurimonas sp. HSL-1716]|uniref:hypothetical protein n=1 Tax=Hydrocurvibacter sulfurireducens TaxID=3131937 RepID=UPI0031F8E1BE
MIQISAAAALLVNMTGCSAIKESLASQVEVPTLEKQVNRVAIGMTIVRENNVMSNLMEISGDAVWPRLIAADLNATEQKYLAAVLKKDPYYMTVRYSEPIQRKMLGCSAGMKQLNDMTGFDISAIAGAVADPISPLTYRAVQKLEILYGKNRANWPDPFEFDPAAENFLSFKNAKLKLVEASTTDAYKTLDEALIALTPTNYQKDLTQAKDEMLKAQKNVASLKGQEGSLKTVLNQDQEKRSTPAKNPGYTPLSEQDKKNINDQLNDLAAQITQAEADADEKQKIYFTLLDDASTALKSDIKLDKEQVKLARNVNIVSKEIENGADEAYSAFGVALANVGTQPILQNFPTELVSLARAAARFPRFAEQFKIRIERLTKNALYFLPNMGMGSYYAHKQAAVAAKYEEITNIIVEAADAKAEADKASVQDAKEQKNEDNATSTQQDVK